MAAAGAAQLRLLHLPPILKRDPSLAAAASLRRSPARRSPASLNSPGSARRILCKGIASSSDPPAFSGGSGGEKPPKPPKVTGGGGDPSPDDGSGEGGGGGPIKRFLDGWRARVAADPEFPFKVLMEELVGVSANVLGDMASRPNFGLNELDFVFSTLVVGSIVNFVLMYLLAPTTTAAGTSSAIPSYVFQPGPYSPAARLACLISKGAAFAVVGFTAGLAGTAISNGLIKLRKKVDPSFKEANRPPPTVLNALTWAAHMGASANLRYQTVNGLETLAAGILPPALFKVVVVAMRCANNLAGGMSFVMLARLTGSQKAECKGIEEAAPEEKLRLVAEEEEELRRSGDNGGL